MRWPELIKWVGGGPFGPAWCRHVMRAYDMICVATIFCWLQFDVFVISMACLAWRWHVWCYNSGLYMCLGMRVYGVGEFMSRLTMVVPLAPHFLLDALL